MEALGNTFDLTADVAPTKQTTSPIYKLPAEIRNRIYELALYHDENEGDIKPAIVVHRPLGRMKGVLSAMIHGKLQNVVVLNTVVAAMRVQNSMKEFSDSAKGDEGARALRERIGWIEIEESERETEMMPLTKHFSVLPDDFEIRPSLTLCWEYNIRKTRYHGLDLQKHIDSGGRVTDLVVEKTFQDHRGQLYPTSKFFVCGHFCTKKCAAQPPLTRVSREVRKKTLSVFYSVNKFVLERPRSQFNDLGEMDPWWLDIGDANLRLMRDVYVFQPSFEIRFYRDQGQNVIVFRRGSDGEYSTLDDKRVNGKRKLSIVQVWHYPFYEVKEVKEDKMPRRSRRTASRHGQYAHCATLTDSVARRHGQRAERMGTASGISYIKGVMGDRTHASVCQLKYSQNKRKVPSVHSENLQLRFNMYKYRSALGRALSLSLSLSTASNHHRSSLLPSAPQPLRT